jgi:hypothetical protein
VVLAACHDALADALAGVDAHGLAAQRGGALGAFGFGVQRGVWAVFYRTAPAPALCLVIHFQHLAHGALHCFSWRHATPPFFSKNAHKKKIKCKTFFWKKKLSAKRFAKIYNCFLVIKKNAMFSVETSFVIRKKLSSKKNIRSMLAFFLWTFFTRFSLAGAAV